MSILDYLCCNHRPSLQIDGHSYRIVKLLGDGGYAFVYLVSKESTGEQFALKKIRCMFGGESVANAMREIEASKQLQQTGKVVPCLGSQVIQEEDGTKTVFILMPHYKNGTLQDKITNSNTNLPENEVVEIGIGIAECLMAIHGHVNVNTTLSPTTSPNEENDRLLSSMEMGDLVPFAHRDLKPANIMFQDNGEVILIDLGSCSEAKIDVSSRQRAQQLQDMAAEHCTLPYRAPELFEVRTGSRVDEKVDVWGFGCTLYCTMYKINPFEREEQQGGNINICISRGNFSFPKGNYSEGLKSIVKDCLNVKASERPTMEEVRDRLIQLR